MRSIQEWRKLIKGKKSFAIAELALADMIGYRKTSLKRADDHDNLSALIQAVQLDTLDAAKLEVALRQAKLYLQDSMFWHAIVLPIEANRTLGDVVNEALGDIDGK